MLPDSANEGEIARLARDPLALCAVAAAHHLPDAAAKRDRLFLGAADKRRISGDGIALGFRRCRGIHRAGLGLERRAIGTIPAGEEVAIGIGGGSFGGLRGLGTLPCRRSCSEQAQGQQSGQSAHRA